MMNLAWSKETIEMKKMAARMANYRWGLILTGVSLLAILMTVVGSWSTAWAQTWVTAGSTGTVDTADTNTIVFNQDRAELKASATLPAKGTIRYNIVNTGLGSTPNTMDVRFRDNGPGARVVVRMNQINISTGVVSRWVVFDSNVWAPSSGYQVQIPTCGLSFDFSGTWEYFLEATLSKTDATGAPGLAEIVLGDTYCP